MATTYHGIDYSLGKANFNQETGTHFGVIPAGDICQAWGDSSEDDYGDPTCPQCGNEVEDMPDRWRKRYPKNYADKGIDKVCRTCKTTFDNEDCYGESPIAFTLDDGEYKAIQGGDDCDVFILASPYITHAQFCSPCAPGACYLRSPTDDSGPRAYCFGPDWFDEEYPCPYPVYRADTGERVYTPKEK